MPQLHFCGDGREAKRFVIALDDSLNLAQGSLHQKYTGFRAGLKRENPVS